MIWGSWNPFSGKTMLGFSAAAIQPPTPISIPSISTSKPLAILLPPITNRKSPSSTLKSQSQKNSRKFVVRAENGNNGPSSKSKEEIEKKEDDGSSSSSSNNNNEKNGDGGEGEEDVRRRNGRPTFNLRWGDLLLDPDPDNILAVGLTGLLAWASVQVLWQLFFISLAIIVAALKYSFIAALLLFILITLL